MRQPPDYFFINYCLGDQEEQYVHKEAVNFILKESMAPYNDTTTILASFLTRLASCKNDGRPTARTDEHGKNTNLIKIHSLIDAMDKRIDELNAMKSSGASEANKASDEVKVDQDVSGGISQENDDINYFLHFF